MKRPTFITAEQGIAASIKQFTDAWNAHDAHSLAQLFAADADFTNVFGHSSSGREAIERHHAPILQTIFHFSTVSAERITVRQLTEHLAAVDVVWTMVGAKDPQGNPWPERRGLMNLVMQHNNDRWEILIMHNMDLPIQSSVS